MSIKFRQVTWRNFLSTGNAPTTIKLDRSRSTLIVGSNGAGKSTILDAISFALYNKPFRKINKPQLINTLNNKELVVEIEFDVNEVPYKVVRGMKPNLFEVYRNGALVDQSASARDYQEYLENSVLKMNHRSFCQVVVLGSAGYVPFMQLPASHRREIIEDLLDIQIFSTMNVLLKERISRNKDEISTAKNKEELIIHKLELQRNLIARLNREKARQNSDAQEKLKNLESTKQEKLGEVKVLQETQNRLIEDSAGLQSVSDKMFKVGTLKDQLVSKTSHVEKEIKFYSTTDSCPTCRQSISGEFKESMVAGKKKSLAETEDAITKMEEMYSGLRDEYVALKKVADQLMEVRLKIKSLESEIKMLDQQAAEVRANSSSSDDIQSEIDSETKKLIELQTQLKQTTEHREQQSKHSLILNAASAMLKDGGIKTRIIRQYIPIMNKLINKYLAAMDFFVHFELDEQFNEVIKSRGRDEFSYNSFSEGEKMRINLAILFTWRAIAKMRNTASTNLLMMDEVFDSSLDATGTEEFIKIIEELTKDTNVFVISHKADNLYDKFHSVIRFEKHKNFSRMAT